MANIHDQKHTDHIETPAAGEVLVATDPRFVKGVHMHGAGKLTFTFVSESKGTENADGSVTDRWTIDRTYNPNPKK